MKKRNLGHRQKVALTTVTVILFCIMCFVQIAELFFLLSDSISVFKPDYAQLSQLEMTQILQKSSLTDEDYATLYAQTGLSKVGIQRELKRGNDGIAKILSLQENYFFDYQVDNRHVGPFMCSDYLANNQTSTVVTLEGGDIIITSTTHLSGWRMGHSAIALSPTTLAEATMYGRYSHTSGITSLSRRANFIVLSPKEDLIDSTKKAEIAKFVRSDLLGLPYDITIGLFSPKNSINATHCSHMIWYAYNHFGFDIDSDRGMFVSPQDFLKSEFLEVVQVFGFDPYKLWE